MNYEPTNDGTSNERTGDRHQIRQWRSPARAAVVLTVLAIVAGLLVAGSDGSEQVMEVGPASTPATVSVSGGDLTISDRLDGSVVRSSELVVVHRVSGETPGAAAGSGSADVSDGRVVDSGIPLAVGWLAPVATGSGTIATAGRLIDALAGISALAGINALAGIDEGSTTTEPVGTSTGPPSTTRASTTATTSPTAPTEGPSTSTPTTTPTSTPTPSSWGGPVTCPDGGGESGTTTSTTGSPSTTDVTGSSTTSTTSTTSTAPTVPVDQDDCTTSPTVSVPSDQGSRSGGGGSPTGSGGGGAGAASSSPNGSGVATATIATEIVTSTRTAGEQVTSGDVLYSVEGRPVIALRGDVPAWRDLNSSVDDGIDVLQLETALAALGYDGDGALIVDQSYDANTTAAVAEWQEGLGLDPTGDVALGSIVFIPEAAVVTDTIAAIGAEVGDGDTILRLGTPDEEVTATVPEELRAVVTAGLEIEVLGVSGTVTRLSSVASDDGVVVLAHISVAGELSAEAGEEVTVRFTVTDAADVLLVPVEAIASLLDGGYAVHVANSAGQKSADPTWVSVTVLGVSGGQAAVAADGLADGTVLVVPG